LVAPGALGVNPAFGRAEVVAVVGEILTRAASLAFGLREATAGRATQLLAVVHSVERARRSLAALVARVGALVLLAPLVEPAEVAPVVLAQVVPAVLLGQQHL
jgi:hypothetical protein